MSIPISKIVVVPFPISLASPLPKFKYAVLIDKTPDEIVAFARAHPKVYVYPFITGPVEIYPNFEILSSGDRDFDHVLMPMYVGNISPVEDTIRECVARAFPEADFEELKEIAMKDSTMVDDNSPTANMYGCEPCPKCGKNVQEG